MRGPPHHTTYHSPQCHQASCGAAVDENSGYIVYFRYAKSTGTITQQTLTLPKNCHHSHGINHSKDFARSSLHSSTIILHTFKQLWRSTHSHDWLHYVKLLRRRVSRAHSNFRGFRHFCLTLENIVFEVSYEMRSYWDGQCPWRVVLQPVILIFCIEKGVVAMQN